MQWLGSRKHWADESIIHPRGGGDGTDTSVNKVKIYTAYCLGGCLPESLAIM